MNDQDDLPPEFADIPRDQLKHGTGRYRHVILVPQPSDSPNDPLNVSLSRCPSCPRRLLTVGGFAVAPMVSMANQPLPRLPPRSKPTYLGRKR